MVSNMFNYLSYVYYNKKGYRLILAGPTRISGKPNAYGFGTFFHDRAAQTYVDKLSDLSRPSPGLAGQRRVSIRTSAVRRRDGSIPPPLKSGGFESRLFVVR